MDFQIVDNSFSLIPGEIYFSSWKKYSQMLHAHDAGCLEINYIIEGSCSYLINGNSIGLNKRSILLHNGHQPHEYHVQESCLNMSIICYQRKLISTFSTLSSLLTEFPNMKHFLDKLENGIVLRNAGNMYALAKEINDCFNTKACDLHLNLLITKLLIDSLNNYEFNSSSTFYSEQIREYIRYHYFTIQNLDEIADKLSLNKIYMERIFKQETGTSIWNYLNNFRLEKAVYYLTKTKVPIGEIDELVGIHSRQNFYILFKKKYQISPKEFRETYS